jgi:NTP pyrophosphatase (non-canonical NTP hydrolase)
MEVLMSSDAQTAYEAYYAALGKNSKWSDADSDVQKLWRDACSEMAKSPAQRLFDGLQAQSHKHWESVPADRRAALTAAAAAVRPQSIRDWTKAIHQYALDKGWWDKERAIGDIFILFASEVHEAYDEYRNGREVTEIYYDPAKPEKPEGVPVELADVVIRILDFCGRVGIDLQAVMEEKHAFNLKRPYRHGNKRT